MKKWWKNNYLIKSVKSSLRDPSLQLCARTTPYIKPNSAVEKNRGIRRL